MCSKPPRRVPGGSGIVVGCSGVRCCAVMSQCKRRDAHSTTCNAEYIPSFQHVSLVPPDEWAQHHLRRLVRHHRDVLVGAGRHGGEDASETAAADHGCVFCCFTCQLAVEPAASARGALHLVNCRMNERGGASPVARPRLLTTIRPIKQRPPARPDVIPPRAAVPLHHCMLWCVRVLRVH